MGGRAFWGSGPCCDASEGEKGQTRTYALLSGHFPQSADEGNHPVALRRAEFSTQSSFSPSPILSFYPLFFLFLRSLDLYPISASLPALYPFLSFSVAFFYCFPLSYSLFSSFLYIPLYFGMCKYNLVCVHIIYRYIRILFICIIVYKCTCT